MSEESGRNGNAGENSGAGKETLHGLPPHSYTANRLVTLNEYRQLSRELTLLQHHASERHLHLTTRRTFIGPIPDAWISKHRKSWYKYRPRMLTYSSKTASFNAARNPADWRQLTGLDVNSVDRGKQTGLSFPQPDDVDEDAASDHGDGETRGNNRPPDPTKGSRIPPTSPSAKQTGLNIPSSQRLSPRSVRDRSQGGLSSSSEARSFTTAKGAKSQDGTSFITAKESLGSSPPFDSTGSSPNSPNTGGPDSPIATEDQGKRYSNGTGGILGDVGGELRKSGSGESTSSLLPHNEATSDDASSPTATRPLIKIDTSFQEENEGNLSKVEDSEQKDQEVQAKEPPSKHALLEVPAEAYHEDSSNEAAGPSSLRHVEPVSTGLVRFNIPDDLAHRGEQAKGRVSEATSRAGLHSLHRAKAEPGQLLKAERMLVRVDTTKHELPNNYSENDSLKAETNTVEKWREFIVACRRSPGDETEFTIQMNKTRVIPMLDKEHRSKKSAHQITLLPKETKVNMFSSLDKTIVIWAPWRKETRIYLLRPRSSASSVEWFTFLNFILGWRSPSKLRIHVPDLDVNLELTNPLRDADVLKASSTQSELEGQTHDQVAQLADGHIARDIIDQSLEVLKKSEFEDVFETWSKEGERIGLAWKRYDRLEWVHGANEERMYGSMAMHKTHDLELRPKRHYPTLVAKNPTMVIEEPAPVEGFLVRQTSQKGTHKRFGKTFFKRLYFSTHNSFLCFSEPGRAFPPKPPELHELDEAGLPRASDIAKIVPLVYSVDPYPLQNGSIKWLSGNNYNRKKIHDQLAYEESERSLKLLLEAEGYINLCHVVRIRRLKSDGPAPPEQGQEQEAEDSEDDDAQAADHPNNDEIRTFEIVLRNGLVIRLQAFNKETRKQWVKCLREIVEYWKLRTAEDMETYRLVRQANLDSLNVDEEMESFLGQEAQKWEVSRSVASPELFHMCGISCCRQVTVGRVRTSEKARLMTNRCLECYIASLGCIHRSRSAESYFVTASFSYFKVLSVPRLVERFLMSFTKERKLWN